MKKILLIEDEYKIRIAIKDILAIKGYDVYAVSEGEEALKLIEKIMPDLILCDIMMPGMDGYQVLEKIMENEEFARIPFIFLTAKGEYKDLRKGMELGADDYLPKPVKSDDLINAIETRLKKSQFVNSNVTQKTNNEEKKDYIFIADGKTPKIVKFKNIVYITSFGDYSHIHTNNDEKIITRKLLKAWERILPSNSFIRIHRSTIINLEFLIKIEKWTKYTYKAYLQHSKDDIVVSSRYYAKMKEIF
ncbi:MAG: response regulator [Melioribacteraceae bacterium]|nr:response regulator [Melioribacteraceae bacterium]